MDKERLFGVDGGYSEAEADKALDKQKNNDLVTAKSGNIFVAPQKNKKQEPTR